MFYVYVCDHTHFCFFMSGPKKGKNVTLTRQTLGETDLKHGMHTLLDFGSNMGGIPPGYTISNWCVKCKDANKKKKELLNNAWTKGVRFTNTLYIFQFKICI